MPTISGIESKVTGFLKTDLAIEAQTTTIDVDFVDEDDNNTSVTLQADTLEFTIDPLNETGNGSERIYAASTTADTPVTGRTRLNTVERGLLRYGTGQTGSATYAKSWPQGTRVAVSTDSLMRAVNILKAYLTTNPSNTTFSGTLVFSGAGSFTGSFKFPVYADATARDAAIPTPTNGMVVYLTDAGVLYQYIGGTWATFATGTVANASTTVAGKVEVATQAQVDAGTDTGETGAPTIAPPSTIAECIQDSTWNFAADAEANDTYAITLTPAIDGYVTGQRFIFTANTANTGAATLNVNAKGAKDIKKAHDQALVTGDIEAGQVVEVVYDGTNMQMVSQTGIATDSLVPKTALGSQSGTATTGAQSADATGNMDIDITPFASTDTLLVTVCVNSSHTLNHASNPDKSGQYFYTLTGIVGGEYSGYSLSNTKAAGAGVTLWEGGTTSTPALISGAWAVAPALQEGAGSSTMTLTAPSISGNNLRIPWAHVFVNAGSYTASATTTVVATVTRLTT